MLPAMENEDMMELTITGMTCTSCASHIEKGLARIRGVRRVAVSYPDRRAEIEADPAVTPAALIAAVEALGYGAAPLVRGENGAEDDAPAACCAPSSAAEGEACAGPGCGEATPQGGAEARPALLSAHRPRHIAIIGSGGAATAAALRAAEAGAEVSVIERGLIGGTCVNVGCVPSKIMIAAARIQHLRRESPFDAALPPAPPAPPSLAGLRAMMDARVETLRREKYETLLTTTPGIRLIRGTARFIAADALEIDEAEGGTFRLPFDRALIASGAAPVIPDIPGIREVAFWTSTEALAATELPESLAILGGGNVAVELAQAFARLGTEVHLITRRGLLSALDPEIGAGLAEIFRAEGIALHLHTTPVAVRTEGGRIVLRLPEGELRAARLLVATGRRPQTAALGLERAGVACDEAGAIRVDAALRTTAPGIFAAGDCTTLPHYVYVAAAAGSVAAHNMLAATGGERRLDLAAMPAVVFTDPEVATVGLAEAEAGRRGLAVEVRTLPLEAVPRALANFDTRGFVKLVAERGSGRLLGVQALAAGAGEFITTAALALRAGLTAEALGEMLFPYLTMAEGLKLAAQSFSRDITRLSCCAA